MPLKLSAAVISRVAPRPPFRDQLADHIRQAITTGDLHPGESIPGEYKIAQDVGVDRATVRFAIGILVSEGLLNRASGKSTTVAEPPTVRVLDTQRYRDQLAKLRAGEHNDTAAFVTDHGADWESYTCNPLEYAEEPAGDKDAELLGLEKGAKLIRRRMVKRLGGKPVQIQRSTVPLKLAKGTVLADQTAQPYPGGTLAELYDAGLIPDGARLAMAEEATSRMPNTTERRLLAMEVAAPVWDIVRVFSVDGMPVEVSRVIAPTAQNKLRYETDFS